MVDSEKTLHDLISSSLYQERLDALCSRSIISINAQYSDVIFKFDRNRLELSGLSVGDVKNLLDEEWGSFFEFCVRKIEFFKIKEDVQEFPKGEEVESFEQNEKLLGFSRGILIMYAIEFLLAIKGIKLLEEYAKKSRIPQSRQYSKDVFSLIGK
ncbi:hypothetical protein [Paraburkholderia bannensis]|uniref:hypothetical protein n=1 Tax=Paraburkholderia bannensis TaxID=765414 RepID=UPI002AB5E0E8|nr:hypothetical protein [Paraburkholderia bannensis]